MKRVIHFILSLLFITGIAYGVDRVFNAPSGNLVLDANGDIQAQKTLKVDTLKSKTGASTPIVITSDTEEASLKLDSSGSSAARLNLEAGTGGSAIIDASTTGGGSGTLLLRTAGTTKTSIDSDGNISMTGELSVSNGINASGVYTKVADTLFGNLPEDYPESFLLGRASSLGGGGGTIACYRAGGGNAGLGLFLVSWNFNSTNVANCRYFGNATGGSLYTVTVGGLSYIALTFTDVGAAGQMRCSWNGYVAPYGVDSFKIKNNTETSSEVSLSACTALSDGGL